MALSLARIRAINAVAVGGSYAAAARMLGLSQPAVSRHVREVEAEYGVQLFDRRDGVLHPTPLCVQLSDIGERITQGEREAGRILARSQSLEAGRLSIGLGNTMPGIALIAAFHKRYPTVEMDIKTGSHDAISKALIAREIDVGVLPDVIQDARLRRERLVRQDVVAIVHPDNRLAGRASVSCADLMREKLIFRSRGSSTQRVVDRAFRATGFAPVPLLTLDTRDGVYEAVANGLGVGFMWRYGTSRTGQARRITIREMPRRYEEVVFALTDHSSILVDAFFGTIKPFLKDNDLLNDG